MITFKLVRWKNFLSTGNAWTEVNLNRSPNTLIVGENGSGKSTVLDALCFGLFNKPFRKINKPQLLNTINKKDLMVEIEFVIGTRKYKVVRGMKPGVFEIYIDGEMQNQSGHSRDYQELLERTILKLNYKSFTQIVILGSSSFVPFMQLPAAARREVIEDLLDIQIFSSMNLLLKDRMAENKNDIGNAEYEIKLTKEKIKIQREYLGKMKAKNQGLIEDFRNQISDTHSSIKELNSNREDKLKEISIISSLISDENAVHNKNGKIKSLIDRLERKHKTAHKRINFFEKNDSCPTCEQIIDLKIKSEKIQDTNNTIAETEDAIRTLEEEGKGLEERIRIFDEYNANMTKAQKTIVKIDSQITANQNNIGKLQENIDKIEQAEESDDTSKDQLKELKKELETGEENLEELHFDRELYNTAASMLRDGGIKTKIIKQYVPIMNKLINKYLASLDFFVAFQLDEEFNEVIKSRFRDDFSYQSFIEGEKMRIDLALLFTWRAVAKLKNSTNTNLLVLDEVFDASLDTNGCDEFLKLIQQLSGETNVFVISHKGDILYDKFHSQIKFEKVKNFSRIVA